LWGFHDQVYRHQRVECVHEGLNASQPFQISDFVIEKSLWYKLDSTIIDATDSMFNNEIISSN
jgi:hypothetical protein